MSPFNLKIMKKTFRQNIKQLEKKVMKSSRRYFSENRNFGTPIHLFQDGQHLTVLQ